MGLFHSNAKSDSAIIKEAVLKEALSLLSNISASIKSDPKETQKTISSIISLSETENERAAEARNYISQHEVLLDQVKQDKKLANDALIKAENRNKDAEIIEKQNAEKSSFLVQKEQGIAIVNKLHAEKDKAHEKITNELAQKKEELAILEKALNDKEILLNIKHQAIMDHEDQLREKAKRLKSVAENF